MKKVSEMVMLTLFFSSLVGAGVHRRCALLYFCCATSGENYLVTGFIRKLITRRIVAKIDITIYWTDVDYHSHATYCLTETIFGGRSWFLTGSVWPANENAHPRFSDVMSWVKNGQLPDSATFVENKL